MIITQEKVRELRLKMQAILDEFAEANGVHAMITGGTYTLNNATYKLELAVVEEDGEVRTRDAEHFIYYASMFGLTPNYLGKTFQHDGKLMKIVGLKRKNRSYPIMVEADDGTSYKYPPDLIKKLVVLEKQP